MRHLLFRITFVAAALLLPTSIGFACTCGPRVSVLTEYERSQVVLIARVISIEESKQQEVEGYGDGGSFRMVVEKIYKGNVRAGDELVFARGNGVDCAWALSERDLESRALLYLNSPPAGSDWRVSACGRSTGIKRATEDLLYLDKLDQVRGKTRVSGRYGRGYSDDTFTVSGRKIRIVGENGSYETKTDENGIFEIYDLPHGDYRLEPELPEGTKIDRDWLWFSDGASKDQSTDTYVTFTLKPQKDVSLELGLKPNRPKGVRPR